MRRFSLIVIVGVFYNKRCLLSILIYVFFWMVLIFTLIFLSSYEWCRHFERLIDVEFCYFIAEAFVWTHVYWSSYLLSSFFVLVHIYSVYYLSCLSLWIAYREGAKEKPYKIEILLIRLSQNFFKVVCFYLVLRLIVWAMCMMV